MRRSPVTQRKQRDGIVLLLILVALIVAATALVSVARQSYRLGVDAQRARHELQQKWGPTSLRRALLPVAQTIFEQRDKQTRKANDTFPPPQLSGQLRLGNAQVQFVLADEDARANVNTLYHYSDAETAAAIVKELSGAFDAVALNAESAPVGAEAMVQPPESDAPPAGETSGRAADPDDEEPDLPRAPIAFRAWGQVFNLSRVPNLQQTTQQITCWGRESLNINRAEEATAVELAGMIIGKGKARRMINDYRRKGSGEVDLTIDRYASNPKHRLQLKHLLSGSSMCYSLWVRSMQKAEVRDSFAVLAPTADGTLQTTEIEYRGR